jgi:hypothetical protein
MRGPERLWKSKRGPARVGAALIALNGGCSSPGCLVGKAAVQVIDGYGDATSTPAVHGTLRSRSKALRWLAAMSGENPSWAAVAGVAAAAVVVAVLHWLQAAGLSSGNGVVIVLSVGVAAVMAVACWALLLWLFWRTRLDPSQPGYVLAVVLSVVTICVALEAFAGVSTLLWQRGMIWSPTPNVPSLWRAEGHYLWNLLGSVPLLSAPQTVGWRDPQPFADHVSGFLLLSFKIAIIAPLVRLGLSGYQVFEARRVQARVKAMAKADKRAEEAWLERRAKWEEEARARRETGETLKRPYPSMLPTPYLLRPWQPGAGEVWGLFTGLMGGLIVAVAAVAALFNPGSWVNRWLSKHLRPGITIHNHHLRLGWLHTGPQWLVLAVLVVAIGYAVLNFGYGPADPDKVRSIPFAAGAILTYFWLLAILTLTVAATSLALLHVGVAVARPHIPAGSQPEAAVNAYTWAVANALPGPNIPTTLNWTLHYRFVDHWSDILLLLYKVAFAAVLLFPLYRIIRVYAERSRPVTTIDPALPAARQFLDLLSAARTVLDRLEGRTATKLQQESQWAVGATARRALIDLESALENVRSLFGDGDVTRTANAAEAAARNRHSAITSHNLAKTVRAADRYRQLGGRSYGRSSPPPSDLDEPRVTLDRRISEYSQSAKQILREAADAHSYRLDS